MEFPSSSPESSPGLTPSSEKGKDSDKNKEKKKSTGSVAIRADSYGDKSKETKNPEWDNRRTIPSGESLWQKIKRESAPVKRPEVPLFGIEEPDTRTEKSDEDNAALVQAGREFTEIRLKDNDEELHELPLERKHAPEAAEAAAGVALMRAMHDSLLDETSPVGQTIDRAEQQVEDAIRQLPFPGQRQPERFVDGEAPFELVDSSEQALEPADGAPEIAYNDDVTPNAPDPALISPSSGSASRGGFGGAPPRVPGGFGGMPYPHDMPESPISYGTPPTAERMPGTTAAAAISETSVQSVERSALQQGLLVGGLTGYLFGRNRGRKQGRATAEQQFIPSQRKLEKQVRDLQETITTKEQKIRAVARETFATIGRRQDRERFVDDLQLRTGVADRRNTPLETARRVPNMPPPLRELYSREAPQSAMPGSEVLLTRRYGPELTAAEQVRPGRSAEVSQVVPFDKKAEDFTRAELMQTAEKIKVQGVSLKEMVELGSLDEKALRRVTQEFLDGGNVSAAVAREVGDKELKFERDPKLRHIGDNRQGGTSDQASVDGFNPAVTWAAAAARDRERSQDVAGRDGRQPTPDAARVRAIRNKQAVAVGSTTVGIILLILSALWLTS